MSDFKPIYGSPSQRTTRRIQSRSELMHNFWGEEQDTSSTSAQSLNSGAHGEYHSDVSQDQHSQDQQLHRFFAESVFNPKLEREPLNEAVSRRIQVGLYPEDAQLLEEIFSQSKAAGLKNVSRARILRVALRHFHTCWLSADS